MGLLSSRNLTARQHKIAMVDGFHVKHRAEGSNPSDTNQVGLLSA